MVIDGHENENYYAVYTTRAGSEAAGPPQGPAQTSLIEQVSEVPILTTPRVLGRRRHIYPVYQSTA